jgi:hypothetical protein
VAAVVEVRLQPERLRPRLAVRLRHRPVDAVRRQQVVAAVAGAKVAVQG